MEYTKEQIEEWKKKAENYDYFLKKLEELLSEGYDEESDTFNEEEEVDLCDIGQFVMQHFNYH